jgi:ribosomal-protein-alanine N-acetyltransferase
MKGWVLMKQDMLFKQFPYIESDELTLRKIEKSDLNDFYEMCSNERLYRYKPGIVKKSISTVENMIGHYERDFRKKKVIFLGICLNDNNKLVGVAEIFDFDMNVNQLTIGYTLNEDYWGRGIATKTTKLLLDYLFNVIDVNRIQAYVMPINIKSQNVLIRNGFTKEGTIRQGHMWTGKGVVDLELYSILKSEFEK